MSIGVARYDMVVVSKPSMAAVRIGKGKAHSRNGSGRCERAVWGRGESESEARLVVVGAEKLGLTGVADAGLWARARVCSGE